MTALQLYLTTQIMTQGRGWVQTFESGCLYRCDWACEAGSCACVGCVPLPDMDLHCWSTTDSQQTAFSVEDFFLDFPQ